MKTSASKLGLKLIGLIIICLIIIPVVWFVGLRSNDQPAADELDPPTVTEFPEEETDPSIELLADGLQLQIPDSLHPDEVEFEYDQWGSQATFIRVDDGATAGTHNQRQARAGLSLTKLYIGYYALEYGSGNQSEQDLVLDMITRSSDSAAAQLFATYPESIDEVAEEFGLYSTRSESQWGYSLTSTYDVSVFVAALMRENPDHFILDAMTDMEEYAYDSYPQEFGTAEINGALGTKSAWSDRRDMHATVTFGDGWVAAASLYGTRDALTAYATEQLQPYVDAMD